MLEDDPSVGVVADDAYVLTALRLMRLALPLLDRAGCDLAAARLQHAVDEVDVRRDLTSTIGRPVEGPD